MKSCCAARRLIGLFCLGVMLMPPVSWAQSGIAVTNAWARATVPAQRVGGVYMEIRSAAPARLLSVSSLVAARAEIHGMKMEGGVMKMFPVDGIDLPAGKTVKLEPGGYHVMLMDLKHGLTTGESVPLTLTFESSRKTRHSIGIKAEVRSITGAHAGH